MAIDPYGGDRMATTGRAKTLTETALLPPGFTVPASRWTDPATRLRELLDDEPYVFAPGIYDPHGAQIAMYHRAAAIYFSGYSFAIGHLGTTDMDLYSGPEIADGARRTVSALRKFQLTMALGDPEKGVAPRHLEIPPVVVDMDGGYGNLYNVQRTTELYVNAWVAGAHLEDQVLPKRCGHIAGKALISADEMIGKLRMARAAAEHLVPPDFAVIPRTDALSATSTAARPTSSGPSSRIRTAARPSASPIRCGVAFRTRPSPSTGPARSSGSTIPTPRVSASSATSGTSSSSSRSRPSTRWATPSASCSRA